MHPPPRRSPALLAPFARSKPFALFLLAVLGQPIPAQDPAPGGETRARDLHGPWSAGEALAWQRLEIEARLLREREDARLLPGESLLRHVDPLFLGLAGAWFPATGTGFGDPQHGPPAGPWVLYLWPREAGDGTGLAFCLASDGRLLVSDNRAGYLGDTTVPDAAAATGGGSRGRFADVLSSPGKGQDGGMWQTAATLRPHKLAIALRDEEGRPLAGGRVALLPGHLLRPLGVHALARAPAREEALPAGCLELDAAGRGTLLGIPATGLYVCAGIGSMLTTLPADAIESAGDRLVLTLPVRALLAARLHANESAAIATLKNIGSAQAQCQAAGVIDANGNGAGEYGFFAELAGAVPVRTDGAGGVGTTKISPPVLSRAFARVAGGRVARSGYVFQMFLPDAGTAAVAEAETGGAAGCRVDPVRAEVLWCCYAWPETPGVSGQRVFFMNQAGCVLAAPNADGRYAGASKPASPAAAFAASGTGRLDTPVAAGGQGKDGQAWTVVH